MFETKQKKMKIAVIGAGPTGLASAKYALEEGYQCDVYEQTGALGGTWVYTDRVGVDENDLPIHSSMYQGLMTNLPKEVMSFSGFPFPDQLRSYVSQPEVVDYLNSFADRFSLRAHIKYFKCVTKVRPTAQEKWIVTTQDSKTKGEESKEYDGVIVCNGHYRDPFVPKISGQDKFQGLQWHSHTYRTPEPYEKKRVLVIGAGPSGRDISVLISKVAEHVFVSHRGVLMENTPTNLTQKLVVKEFTANGAIFEDDTKETFDIILYCTGYQYSFPFLAEECGIKVENNWVHPLYKQIINIEHPTMCFIGIPFMVCVIPMFDIQARFAMAALGGKFNLPSKENMLTELDEYMSERRRNKISDRHAHRLGGSQEQKNYFEDLAGTAGVEPIPDVINKLYARIKDRKKLTDCFKIVDSENFIQVA